MKHLLQPTGHGKQIFVSTSLALFSLIYEPIGHSLTQCPSSSKTSLIGLQAIQSSGLGPLHCVHDEWHVRVSPVSLSI